MLKTKKLTPGIYRVYAYSMHPHPVYALTAVSGCNIPYRHETLGVKSQRNQDSHSYLDEPDCQFPRRYISTATSTIPITYAFDIF